MEKFFVAVSLYCNKKDDYKPDHYFHSTSLQMFSFLIISSPITQAAVAFIFWMIFLP